MAAAVAATGFVAGAATLALMRRHTARKHARSRQPRRALDLKRAIKKKARRADAKPN